MSVIKNYENKTKIVTITCLLFVTYCIIIATVSIYLAKDIVDDAHKKVYALGDNIPVVIQKTTLNDNIEIEAKGHIELFHRLFFTLAPDEKYINYTMEKAMYLVDETGIAQYNALKEKGFYNNIMGGGNVFSIFCDSIRFDKNTMEWVYFGRQRIERKTSIIIRRIVTAGGIMSVPRTVNNPYGLMITNWRTLLNNDIETTKKTVY